ncbi:MAG: 3-dehydroquinate synthase [Spirochaetota bacterium]|nr:MAG: 3-dehydroquinate synthase [Spirochaetota bacterium]
MEIIEVKAEQPYNVYFGEGVLNEAPRILKPTAETDPSFLVVTDKNVARHYLKPFVSILKDSGFRVRYAVFNPGESLKSSQNLDKLLHKMVGFGLARDSVVIGLGGGVIGDFSGFAASVYMRGIGFIQIPTTLLAQVDSSIGGKVGINLKEGKNLVGSLKSPLFVLIDPSTLHTLGARQIVLGLAEIIKAGLIFDEHLFEKIENFFNKHFETEKTVSPEELKTTLLKDRELLSKIITNSIKIKRDIVEKDEKESGLRMILNFGHTFGHAIENFLHYRNLLHGEAVILGMRIAVELSSSLGMLPESERARIEKLLCRLPIPRVERIDAKHICSRIERDKKKRGGRVHYVLLREIGNAVTETDVDRKMVARAIDHILRRG